MSNRRLQDKVAIITGGASGIGEASARMFAAQGARVVVGDIQDSLGQEVCAEIGPLASYIHCDVSKEEQVQELVDSVVSRHGRLDIMFNNAGVGQREGDLTQLDMEVFDQVLSTNVRGTMLGMKYAARAMIPARSGCIINMASVVTTTAGLAPYSYTASKHAAVGLTRNAAVQLGQFGIRVNCISPGPVETPLFVRNARKSIPGIEEDGVRALILDGSTIRHEGHVLTAEDVAAAAAFLASDEARFISGHNLLVDGAASITNKSYGAIRSKSELSEIGGPGSERK